MTDDPQNGLEFKINRSNLYREESFTDLKVGTIKRLTPVGPTAHRTKPAKLFLSDIPASLRLMDRYRFKMPLGPKTCSRP